MSLQLSLTATLMMLSSRTDRLLLRFPRNGSLRVWRPRGYGPPDHMPARPRRDHDPVQRQHGELPGHDPVAPASTAAMDLAAGFRGGAGVVRSHRRGAFGLAGRAGDGDASARCAVREPGWTQYLFSSSALPMLLSLEGGLRIAFLGLTGTDKKRLQYKLNGLLQFFVITILVAAGVYTQTLDLAWCYYHTVELFVVRIVYSRFALVARRHI